MPSPTTSLVEIWRSLPFLVLTVALAAGGLVATPSGPSEQVPELQPVASQPASPNFTMFSLNVAFTLGPKKARHDINRALTMGADAGGFQEFSPQSHRDSLIALAAKHDWGYWMPSDGAGSASIPIVWNRKRFLMVPGSGTTTMVHGSLGSGYPARHINTVKVRELATGKVFGVINTHAVANASYDALPHDRSGDASRTPYLRRHISMLKQAMLTLHTTTEHVVAVGDLNVNHNADLRRRTAGFPVRVLGPLVSFNMPVGQGSRTGTKSLLDYNMSIKSERGGGFAPMANWIHRGFHSDHQAVVARYRPIDLFATGPVINGPRGKKPAKTWVLERMTRVVRNTEPGATVRLVTPDLRYAPLYRALRDAAQRGVTLKVIADAATPSAYTSALATILGTDTAQPSWIKLCSGACGSSTGRLQPNVVLADRTGGATALTFHGSGTAANAAKNSWNDAFIATDPQLYGGFVRSFDAMAAGSDQASSAGGFRYGGYRVTFRPVTAGGKDTAIRALRGVRCKKARSPRNTNRRTDVLVSMGAWHGKRGKEIARRLGTLRAKEGCTVRAVVGPDVKKPVRRILRKSGVAMRSTATQQALLMVDGRYRKNRNHQIVWTGSQSWVNKGLNGEGITLRVDGESTLRAYRGAFNAAWKQGKKG
ncbi:hypothetical protein [Nocardioides sp.]|uniref:hypothetical protein n=1 Tax=Nocardioides sp. TaxID=35761 RepID=UPI002734B2F7|nr:hypothetical protein [Nocardioides sp.]MDP3889974.1 hypothetical protein [Nocardioides sp.]